MNRYNTLKRRSMPAAPVLFKSENIHQPSATLVTEGQRWMTKGSKRIGVIAEVSDLQVKIVFNEHCLLARRTHSLAEFIEQYTPNR